MRQWHRQVAELYALGLAYTPRLGPATDRSATKLAAVFTQVCEALVHIMQPEECVMNSTLCTLHVIVDIVKYCAACCSQFSFRGLITRYFKCE